MEGVLVLYQLGGLAGAASSWLVVGWHFQRLVRAERRGLTWIWLPYGCWQGKKKVVGWVRAMKKASRPPRYHDLYLN